MLLVRDLEPWRWRLVGDYWREVMKENETKVVLLRAVVENLCSVAG